MDPLSVNGGNNQSGNVRTTLGAPLTVLATINGNPASGVSVTFSDGNAGGAFGSPTVTTNSNGTASTTYTLPSTPQAVTITAGSTSAAIFTETATSNSLVLGRCAGNSQTGNMGTQLPLALCVSALDNGVLTSGVTVTFDEGGVGGSFSSPTVTTWTNGKALTTYTLPLTPQTVV